MGLSPTCFMVIAQLLPNKTAATPFLSTDRVPNNRLQRQYPAISSLLHREARQYGLHKLLS